MDFKLQYRTNIQFSIKLGKELEDVISDLQIAYGPDCPDRTTISRWFHFFRRGGSSVEDAPREGRPLNPVNSRTLDQITKILKENGKISLSILAGIIGEQKGYVANLIYTRLQHRRVQARWVPKILTTEQKSYRVYTSKQILADYKDSWNYLFENFLTVDETWVYYEPILTPSTAGEWQLPGQKVPQVGRIKKVPKKTMATVFWNCKGIVHIDFLKTGKSINSEYYVDLLEKVHQKIPKGKKTKVIFLDDNCPAHTAKITQAKIKEMKWTKLVHPPYSPDLAPSDYYLFRNMKKELLNTRFDNNNDLKCKIMAYFDSKSTDWFYHGIEMFKDQLDLVIKNKGGYID